MVAAVRRNFGIKLLSLALAIVGWAYFRFATNPIGGARFDQQISVPVTAVNVPQGYIAELPLKNIAVSVSPRRGEPAVKPEEVRAVVDLANRGAGVYSVPVQLVAPNVTVQSRTPASLAVAVERLGTQNVPIAVHYIAQDGAIPAHVSLVPASAQVHGTLSDLSRIASVRVDVPLSGSPGMMDQMIRTVPVDARGEEIAGVQVTPNLVRVRAQMLPAGQGRH